MASCLLLSLWEDGWEELEGAELGVLEEPGLVLVQPASRSPERRTAVKERFHFICGTS